VCIEVCAASWSPVAAAGALVPDAADSTQIATFGPTDGGCHVRRIVRRLRCGFRSLRRLDFFRAKAKETRAGMGPRLANASLPYAPARRAPPDLASDRG
jgi:hypothetical protein